jgi:hypothetical protein
MLNYFFIVSFFAFWRILILSFTKFFDYNISKNIAHFIHALIFVIYYNTNFDKSYLINLSTSFYIYDLIYIILQLFQNKNALISQGPFIVHHIIAIYGLYLSSIDISSNFILMIYNILENSNFMLYVAYHVNKSYTTFPYYVYIVEFIQYIWYTYFRIIYFSRYLLSNLDEIYLHNEIISYTLLATLYFMGVFWSYKLFLKNIKNISLILEEIKPKSE